MMQAVEKVDQLLLLWNILDYDGDANGCGPDSDYNRTYSSLWKTPPLHFGLGQ